MENSTIEVSIRDIRILHVIARMNVGGTARYVGEIIKGIPGMNLATGYVQGNELEDKIMNEIDFIRVEHLGRRISPINDLKSWFELWSRVDAQFYHRRFKI